MPAQTERKDIMRRVTVIRGMKRYYWVIREGKRVVASDRDGSNTMTEAFLEGYLAEADLPPEKPESEAEQCGT